MTRIVSSPAIVPTTSGSRARSIATPEQLRLARAGLDDQSCCDDSTLSRNSPSARDSVTTAAAAVAASGPAPGTRRRRPLDQPELLDIARKRRLRDVEARGHQMLPQLLLAAHRLALDDLEDG